MTSSDEMYERGALDAERDELNAFYYQHYYYYRKGYDGTRRRLRRNNAPGVDVRPSFGWLIGGLVLLFAIGGAVWLLRDGSAPLDTLAQTPSVSIALQASPRPTPRPTLTQPAASPTASPAPALAVGRRARVVNLSGAPLRARANPGVNQPIVARIPEGSEVTLLEGPTEADGYLWWRIEGEAGSGWSAQGNPEGTVFFLEPIP
jgi:hypothetical protein